MYERFSAFSSRARKLPGSVPGALDRDAEAGALVLAFSASCFTVPGQARVCASVSRHVEQRQHLQLSQDSYEDIYLENTSPSSQSPTYKDRLLCSLFNAFIQVSNEFIEVSHCTVHSHAISEIRAFQKFFFTFATRHVPIQSYSSTTSPDKTYSLTFMKEHER